MGWLVHIAPRDVTGAQKPLYFASGIEVPMVDGQLYQDMVGTLLTLTTDIFPNYQSASLSAGSGSLSFIVDQALMAIKLYVYDGAAVSVYQGEGESLAAYTRRFIGTASSASFQGMRLTVSLKDLGWQLDRPMNVPSFAGTGDLEGPATLENVPKPLLLGERDAIDFTRYLIDEAYLIYMVSHRSIEGVVRVDDRANEILFSADVPNLAALRTIKLARGEYATCRALGLIRLGDVPTGPAVAHVKGDNLGGYVATAGAVIERVLDDFAELPVSADAVAMAALDAVGGSIGIYLTEQRTAADVIETAVRAVFGWWLVRADDGVLTGGLIDIGEPAQTFTEDDYRDLELVTAPSPIHKLTYTHDLIERVHGADEVATVTADDIDGLSDALAKMASMPLVNHDYEGGDIGWNNGLGFSIIEDAALAINGSWVAVHDMDQVPSLAPSVGGVLGIIDDDEYLQQNLGKIPLVDGDKLHFSGRARGIGSADGEIFLRAFYTDGGNAILGQDDTPPVTVQAGNLSLYGPVGNVPEGATHAQLVWVRRAATQGKVVFDMATYFQNLDEGKLNALNLVNGPIDAHAQVNKPLFGLKAGVDHNGDPASDRVAAVGFVYDGQGGIGETHDNSLTYLPFGNLLAQLRANELETANLAYIPDGEYYIGYDRDQTGYFAHSGTGLTALDMAALLKADGLFYWWNVGDGSGAWVNFSNPAVFAIGKVTKTGGVLVDADYFTTGQPLAQLSEQGATRVLIRDAYDPGVEYRFGDVVTYQDGSYKYINLTPSTGNAPTDAVYWLVLANGTTFHDGVDDPPADSLGVVGDQYWNSESGNVYRKTDAVTWTLIGNNLGGYRDLIFKASATQPATPIGDSPTGWADAPPAASGVPIWTATGFKKADGMLVGAWSTPQQIGGPALEVQYSSDQLNWHSVFLVSDLYMRQRLAGGVWSDAIRIVGENGDPGTAGGYKDFIYQRSATQPTTPTGTSPAGWSDGIPAQDGNPAWESWVWRNADDSLAGNWSVPIAIVNPDFERQYSVNGSTSWHTTPTSNDRYFRERLAGTTTWSAAVPLKGEGALADKNTVGEADIDDDSVTEIDPVAGAASSVTLNGASFWHRIVTTTTANEPRGINISGGARIRTTDNSRQSMWLRVKRNTLANAIAHHRIYVTPEARWVYFPAFLDEGFSVAGSTVDYHLELEWGGTDIALEWTACEIIAEVVKK